MEKIVNMPVAERISHKVKFGNVGDSKRGDNLIDPPIELEDFYYWIRDDKRENKKVLDYLNNEVV